jgi:Nucleotidyltransferase domain.
MKITDPLDNILDNEAKVKILRFLFRTGAEWNGRQIAKQIRAAPATTHKALHELYGEGVLLLNNVGRTHLYKLNKPRILVNDILKSLFAKEDKILDNVIVAIKRKVSTSKIKNGVVSIALFGSVKTKKDHPTSDIDIVVIVENAKVKKNAECLFEKIGEKITDELGNTLSPYINTKSEFKTKNNKGMAVIKDILKNHDLIYGERLETLL